MNECSVQVCGTSEMNRHKPRGERTLRLFVGCAQITHIHYVVTLSNVVTDLDGTTFCGTIILN